MNKTRIDPEWDDFLSLQFLPRMHTLTAGANIRCGDAVSPLRTLFPQVRPSERGDTVAWQATCNARCGDLVACFGPFHIGEWANEGTPSEERP